MVRSKPIEGIMVGEKVWLYTEKEEPIKVLFLAAGRRTQMAEMWMNRGYHVFSYESDLTSPICQTVSVVQATHKWDEEEWLDEISEMFYIQDIKLIIPFQDNAVIPARNLANHVASFGYLEPKAVCSPQLAAEICYDKKLFEKWMLNNFPAIYPIFDVREKNLLKPRFGKGSTGIVTLQPGENPTINLKRHILQRKVFGTEYSVDCYFDPDGNYVDSVPRVRLLVGSSGEVYKSITERNQWLQATAKTVGEKLGIRGPANMQFILEHGTGYLYLFEINARFGGGYTLSIHAGMDAISLIGKDYLEIDYEYEPDMWRDKLLMQRAYRDFYFQRFK
jgi:carbamoyl-phosphate synthase large subunit